MSRQMKELLLYTTSASAASAWHPRYDQWLKMSHAIHCAALAGNALMMVGDIPAYKPRHPRFRAIDRISQSTDVLDADVWILVFARSIGKMLAQ
mmetsp:Transcript_7750/g.19835  ORF Transcript_7750/g.19835 Transcript_7750/m.19835 type:complete len:94 (-) Transcript_7750:451-732(-)